MFAYCLNAPVVLADYSGNYSAAALRNTRDGFVRESGGGGLSTAALSALLTYVSISTFLDVITTPVTKTNEQTKDESVTVVEVVASDINDNAIYFGVDLYGGSMNIITPPMDFENAYVWSALTASSNRYSSRAGWGLYTKEYEDALSMTIALSPIGPVQLDPVKGAHLAHFHTAGRYVNGIYSGSFHIWYG